MTAQRNAASTAVVGGPDSVGAARPSPPVVPVVPVAPDPAGPPRSAWTVIARPSSVASTEPFRSVRKSSAPRASIRASVSGAGCP